MKKLVYALVYFLAISTVSGQSKKMKDIDAIKSMCGCFEIEFNFAETFVLIDDENYKASKIYKAKALEWGNLLKIPMIKYLFNIY